MSKPSTKKKKKKKVYAKKTRASQTFDNWIGCHVLFDSGGAPVNTLYSQYKSILSNNIAEQAEVWSSTGEHKEICVRED